MIEWQTLVGRGNDVNVRHEGRFLDNWAAEDVRARLPAVFARYDPNDLERALGETGRLFSEFAHDVALALQWPYPEDTESAVLTLVSATLKRG